CVPLLCKPLATLLPYTTLFRSHIRKLEKKGSIRDGDEISFHLQRGPLDIRWRAIHKNYREGVSFTDEQVEGVFQKWIHTHAFYRSEEHTSELQSRANLVCRLLL